MNLTERKDMSHSIFKDYVVWKPDRMEKAWKPYIQSKVKIWLRLWV